MGPPEPQYVYRAALVHIHDGDTQTLALDLGCFVGVTRTVRLLGLDTPEVVGASKAAGLAATEAAREWYAAAVAAHPRTPWPLVVATKLDKVEKYGRLLATIYRRDDPVSLNDALVAAGHAVPYLV